jgi:iron complex outermembrane recepter protein
MNKYGVLFLLFVMVAFKVTAQKSIQLSIKNSSGQAVIGANILDEATQKVYSSDLIGRAEIIINDYKIHNIVISYIGFKTLNLTLDQSSSLEIQIVMLDDEVTLEEVTVQSTRVGEGGVFTYQNFDKTTINKLNLGQDLPILLNQATSIITSSDAGNGIGYTGIRVRGSDPTRINITINGIPVNDAESQGVYWVNMPDLASSTNSIQIQRGVGTSTNGAGAFGASININTDKLTTLPYLELQSGLGSFNTVRNTIKLGTGLIKERWSIDGRWSGLSSDGYIDRATADLQSLYLSGGYHGEKDVLKFIYFGGMERTYQAWNGVSQDLLKSNRTYNYTGEYTDQNGKTQYHPDEVDNYAQHNYQLHWIKQINSNTTFNTALHYTHGAGYFEQYRSGDRLSRYGLTDVILSNEQKITKTDLIRRRWLDNDFGGLVFSLNYDPNKRYILSLGGGASRYKGDHFGQVIWAQFMSNGKKDHEYYRNDALKTDINLYAKSNYKINDLFSSFIDLQLRNVDYDFVGFDQNGIAVDQIENFLFFNPKFGINASIQTKGKAYLSYSFGSKEPNRNDFTESSTISRPRPEFLQNLELGYKYSSKRTAFLANFYHMRYSDQLVLSGKINDVGEYSRINIPRSYRTGLELEWSNQIHEKFQINLNSTFSDNKVINFTEFIDQYDADFNYLGQQQNNFSKSPISFSPALIAGASLEYSPIKNLFMLVNNKFVSKQYLDNTGSNNRSIPSYFTTDLKINYLLKTSKIQEIQINLLVNNLLNAQYVSNGYTFAYLVNKDRSDFNFVYPQAGVNALMGVTIKI